MTFSISHHTPGLRLGVNACPGIDTRGHGLTMAVIHDGGCCSEWETGQAATPARAESFRKAAARWGATWPGEPQPAPDSGTAARQTGGGPDRANGGVYGPQLPVLGDLDAATAATAAAIADPAAGSAEVIRAAELEEATLLAYLHRPEAEAVLEAGA